MKWYRIEYYDSKTFGKYAISVKAENELTAPAIAAINGALTIDDVVLSVT